MKINGAIVEILQIVFHLESDTPEPQHERTGNLRVGGRVAHPRFGEGIIKVLEGQGENIKATVLFDEDGQERKLLLRFANLQALD